MTPCPVKHHISGQSCCLPEGHDGVHDATYRLVSPAPAVIALARRWLHRQANGAECEICGFPDDDGHEPTDPCGIVASLLSALTGDEIVPSGETPEATA